MEEMETKQSEVEVATALCSSCEDRIPQEDMLRFEGRWICTSCKTTFFQKLKEGARLPKGEGVEGEKFGGFWIRFAAKMFDGIILGVTQMILFFIIVFPVMGFNGGPGGGGDIIASLIYNVFSWVIGIFYTTFFLGKYGATPGKMVAGLKVVRADGSPLTYGRAFGRHFAELLSGITLYIGYVMAAADEEKRSLHDRVCDTRVIFK